MTTWRTIMDHKHIVVFCEMAAFGRCQANLSTFTQNQTHQCICNKESRQFGQFPKDNIFRISNRWLLLCLLKNMLVQLNCLSSAVAYLSTNLRYLYLGTLSTTANIVLFKFNYYDSFTNFNILHTEHIKFLKCFVMNQSI